MRDRARSFQAADARWLARRSMTPSVLGEVAMTARSSRWLRFAL